ncbi:MAG: sporulation protein YqfD [Clostridia bacterium]|nr:sporulation protein YqfD [Clostridia bacterium]
MVWLYRFFRGIWRVTFRSPNPERILDMTHRYRIPIWHIFGEEGAVSISLSPASRRMLLQLIKPEKEESWEWKRQGILYVWDRFGKRLGLFLGAALFLFFSVFSTLFIWSVEVEGNVLLTEGEICEKMEKANLRPGVPISSVDTKEFSLLFQVENPEFSFASLNIIGTRAVLTVREREAVKSPEPEGAAANLVAAYSGEILRYEVLSGQIAVKRGETVPKGALLISGVVEKPNGTFSVVEARGRVFAKTKRYFEVTVPLKKNEISYTGREEVGYRFEILGLSASTHGFSHSPFAYSEYTEERERLEILGHCLPLLVYTRTHYETEEKIKAITVDRAKNLAYDKYEEYKGEVLLPDYEILEENAVVTTDERGVTLAVELVLSENIGQTAPFSYTEIPSV